MGKFNFQRDWSFDHRNRLVDRDYLEDGNFPEVVAEGLAIAIGEQVEAGNPAVVDPISAFVTEQLDEELQQRELPENGAALNQRIDDQFDGELAQRGLPTSEAGLDTAVSNRLSELGLPANGAALTAQIARFNIREFGAKGDGVTDDTAAVLDAVAKLNAAGIGERRVLDLNGGIYLVTQPVILSTGRGGIANGTLKASAAWTAGPARSVLEVPNSAGDINVYNVTVNANHMAGGVNIKGWRVRLRDVETVGFTPEGNGFVLSGETQAIGCSAFQWHDAFDGSAVNIQANRTADAWVLDHADIKLTQCTGAWSGRTIRVTANCHTSFVVGCHFYNGQNGGGAPHVDVVNMAYEAGANNNTFIGTYWDNGYVDLYSTQVAILDSYFLNDAAKITQSALCRLFADSSNAAPWSTFMWRNNQIHPSITVPTFQLIGAWSGQPAGNWDEQTTLRFATVADEADIATSNAVSWGQRAAVLTVTATEFDVTVGTGDSGTLVNHTHSGGKVSLSRSAKPGTAVQVVSTNQANLTIAPDALGGTLNGSTASATIPKYAVVEFACVANPDGSSAAWTYASPADNPVSIAAGKSFGVPLVAGTYYGAPNGGTTTTILPEGSLRGPLLVAGKSTTLTRIGVETTVAGTAGAVVRLGLYAYDSATDSATLLIDAGTVGGTVVGYQEKVIAQPIIAGQVLILAAVIQGGATTRPTVRAQNAPSAGHQLLGSPTALTESTNGAFVFGPSATVSGALPASYASVTAGDNVTSSASARVLVRA